MAFFPWHLLGDLSANLYVPVLLLIFVVSLFLSIEILFIYSISSFWYRLSLKSLSIPSLSISLSYALSLFQTLLIFFFPSLLLSLSSPMFPPLSPISSLIYFPFSAKLNLHSFISESSSFSHPFSHVRPNIPLNFSLIIILLSSLSLRPHVFSVIALFSSIPSLPPNSLFLLHFNLSFYRPLFRLSRNRNFSLSCIFFLSLPLTRSLSLSHVFSLLYSIHNDANPSRFSLSSASLSLLFISKIVLIRILSFSPSRNLSHSPSLFSDAPSLIFFSSLSFLFYHLSSL